MLVSPAEPPIFKTLGRSSSVPETVGADFLLPSRAYGSVGIQRKEIDDLVASVHDGRLQRELAQAKSLGLFILLIEGNVTWSEDGLLLSRSQWTRAQHLGLMWSVQSRGYWIGSSRSMEESCEWISTLQRWLAKDRHNTLNRRASKPTAMWGRADSRDWQIHVLQGFPGVGYERAVAIVDKFGGLPFTWNVTVEELVTVSGIGTKTAQSLLSTIPAPTTKESTSSELRNATVYG